MLTHAGHHITFLMRLKHQHVLDPAPHQVLLLLPLCYSPGFQNPEPLGLMNGALVIYLFPNRSNLRFFRKVLATDALGRYGLRTYLVFLVWGLLRPTRFPSTSVLPRDGLGLHRARPTRLAVPYVATVRIPIPAFYSER